MAYFHSLSVTGDIMDGHTIGFLVTVSLGILCIVKLLRFLKDAREQGRILPADDTEIEGMKLFDTLDDPKYNMMPGNSFYYD